VSSLLSGFVGFFFGFLSRCRLGAGFLPFGFFEFSSSGRNPIFRSRFLCSVLFRPSLFSRWTKYTGISLLGWLTILCGSSSQLFAILCFPSKATILTTTLSPGCRMGPCTFLSFYHFWRSWAVLVALDASSYAFFNLSFMVLTYFVDGSFFPSTSKPKAMSIGNLGVLPNIRKYE
jgi:hypothetical protein